jgi:hypothetical protein
MGEELKLKVQRADEIFSPRPFMEKVWDGICAAHLIRADCTEKNPNVYHEIGIAHAVGKKVPEGVDTLIEKLRGFVSSH